MRLVRWQPATAAGLYLLIPILLGVLLYSPLFARGIPITADGLLHLYRTVLWSDAWAAGDLWPRWHTLLYQGYGYPLFNFYAPLLYVAGSLASAIGNDATFGLKFALFVTCITYPLGTFLWTRDLFGRLCAVVAAAAYTFAAFRFRELFIQGNYAQFAAWALYPWIFFLWRRLAVAPSRVAFAGAVASLVALLFIHNISAMLFAPALGAYVVWQAIENRASRPWLRLTLAGVCALLIGVAFWLPALGETEFTRVHVLTSGYFDVAGHFITPAEILAPMVQIDERAANPILPYNAGRVPLLLALLGALSLLRPRTTRLERGHLIFATTATLVAGFMLVESSLWVWRTVPYIAFAEFPTRLYGIGSLFVAVLAGASLRWFAGKPRTQSLAALLAVFALILEVTGYQFPRAFLPVRATVEDYIRDEAGYNALGTTSASEYLSTWVQELPTEPAIDEDGNRIALVDPPPGVNGEVVDAATNRLSVRVTASIPAQVALGQFYYPGFAATVDDKPAELAPCTPHGLICVSVPAGESLVEVVYVGTTTQRSGEWLGLLGLVLTVVVLGVGPLHRRGSAHSAGEVVQMDAVVDGEPGWSAAMALIALLGLILVAKALWIAPHTRLFRLASPPGRVQPAQFASNAAVGPGLRLLGWDLPDSHVRQGETLDLRLYWQADERIEEEYSSFAQLIGGGDQREFAGSSALHPGDMPTSAWNPDFYVIDDKEIRVPVDAPPILYTLRVGMAESGLQQRVGDHDLTTRVRVTPATTVRAQDAENTLSVDFDGGPALIGYEIGDTRATTESGVVTLPFTLYWMADEVPVASPQIFVHVLDDGGNLVAQSDGAAYGGLYPIADWLPGEVVRDERELALPADATPSRLLVGLYDPGSLQRLPARSAPGVEVQDDAALIPLSAVP